MNAYTVVLIAPLAGMWASLRPELNGRRALVLPFPTREAAERERATIVARCGKFGNAHLGTEHDPVTGVVTDTFVDLDECVGHKWWVKVCPPVGHN